MIGDTAEEMYALYIGLVVGGLAGIQIALILVYLYVKKLKRRD